MTKQEMTEKLSFYKLKEVAKQTGVHYDVVRRAAQGKDIQYESGRKLAEFLSK